MAERHPVCGQDRQLRDDPQLCSVCDAEIPEEAVPLMMFGPPLPGGDCLAWVYCDDCAGGVIDALRGPFPGETRH